MRALQDVRVDTNRNVPRAWGGLRRVAPAKPTITVSYVQRPKLTYSSTVNRIISV